MNATRKKCRGMALLLFGVIAQQAVFAQETNYHSVSFSYNLPPTIRAEGEAPKTFDIKVMMAGEDPIFAAMETDAAKSFRKQLSEASYKIDFSGMRQVDSTEIGDLHVISIVQALQEKASISASGGIMTSNIAVYTSVRTADGNELYNKQFSNENLSTSYGAALTSAQVGQKVAENAIMKSLEGFQMALTGYAATLNTKLADLSGVKKMPELKAFEEQAKELNGLLSKSGIGAFCTGAEKYIAFWQQQADNHLEKNGDEVKRAAYQNLGLYYILKGNTEKAHAIIEAYKPVDKTVKEMMGLLKYRNSDDLETLMSKMAPEKKVFSLAAADKKITLKEAVVRFFYLKLDGTVTIDARKNAGTYTGTMYVKKPDPGPQKGGGIMDLDAHDFDVLIQSAGTGDGKEIKTSLSKVKSFKDNSGVNYTVIKAGDNMLGDMSSVAIGGNTYILMKETYSSAKISLYRILLPQPDGSENSMLIRKAGDSKGVRTKLINFRKNLADYLSDCTATTDMIRESKNINGDINKILEAYTHCN